MVVSFFRLLSTIWTNPGYVPLGPRRHLDDTKSGRSSEKGLGKDRRTSRTNRQGGHQGSHGGGQIDADNWSVSTDPPPGLERHYQYDVFVCENTGRPIYCQYCQNWKPDRAHHCSELNRCILKMDHFCPWSVDFSKDSSNSTDAGRVGGMVSEYSFKWFIQFTSYASIFCIFTLISIAIFTAERAKRVRSLSLRMSLPGRGCVAGSGPDMSSQLRALLEYCNDRTSCQHMLMSQNLVSSAKCTLDGSAGIVSLLQPRSYRI